MRILYVRINNDPTHTNSFVYCFDSVMTWAYINTIIALCGNVCMIYAIKTYAHDYNDQDMNSPCSTESGRPLILFCFT